MATSLVGTAGDCGDGSTAEQSWRAWASNSLRPYLAVESAFDRDSLRMELVQLYDELLLDPQVQPVTFLLAVLDGAPEWGKSRFMIHSNNCLDPAAVIESKDVPFYRTCATALELYGGCLVDQGPRSLANIDTWKERRFQDGCAAVFSGEGSLRSAIASAVHLRATLADRNAESQAPWPLQFHARVTIGFEWDQAIRCLPGASRGEIILAPECLETLEPAYRQLCFAAGGRIGPADADSPRIIMLEPHQEQVI